jgi:hypothetical protein
MKWLVQFLPIKSTGLISSLSGQFPSSQCFILVNRSAAPDGLEIYPEGAADYFCAIRIWVVSYGNTKPTQVPLTGCSYVCLKI